MKHPEAVIEKAKRIELLLNRVEVGEPSDQVMIELGLAIKKDDLPRLQAKYVTGGRKYDVFIDGRYGHWQTVNAGVREWLYERKEQNKELSAPQLAKEMEQKFGVRVAAGHINYLLRKRGLTNRTGRPQSRTKKDETAGPPEISEQIDENAGIIFPGSSQAGDEGRRSNRNPD